MFTPDVKLDIDADNIVVLSADETREARAFHGLFRALIANMVTGVTNGFEKVLEIVGVGYQGRIEGSDSYFSSGVLTPNQF